MKVIFIEDVPDVALAGETREVADGYGRNYLLPKKLAVLANSAASNIVESQLKKVLVKRAQAEAEMAETAGKINGMEVAITARVGEKDRLYGSVTSADIADALNASAGLVIDKRKVELEEPIREIGSYDITVRFTHDITAAITVMVLPEKVAEEKEEKEEKKEDRKARAKRERKAKAEAEAEEAEAQVEEPEAKVEEAEAQVEEHEAIVEAAEAQVEEPEAKVEEAETQVEEPEVKVEEAETQVEEPEAELEEAEVQVEEPEAKLEEAEVKAEEAGTGVEEAEKKEKESGE